MESAALAIAASTTTSPPAWIVVLAAAITALAAIITSIIAALSTAAAHRSESRAQSVRELEARIADRKFTVYEPMIELLRKALDSKNAAAVPADEEALKADENAREAEISKFSAWIAIYGSDEAIIYFQRFTQCRYIDAPPPIMLRMYVEFVLAARRDMGYPDTKVTGEHILGIRVNDIYAPNALEVVNMSLLNLYARENWSPPWVEPPAAGKRRGAR